MSLLTITTQLGAELIILRKLHALREHARLADNANYNRRLLSRTNGYGDTDNEEAKTKANAVNYFDDVMVANLEEQYRGYRDVVEDAEAGFFYVLAAEIAAAKEDIEAAPLEYDHEDTDGVITIKERRGMWGAFVRWMELNGHYVVANVVTPGSLTAGPGVVGDLTGTTLTFKGHCPSGVFTFKCTNGSVSTPEFSVSLKIDTGSKLADGTERIDAASRLTLEKAFSDGETGCNGVVLTRTKLTAPDKTGDANDILTNMEFGSPQDADCDGGVFYVTVQRLADDQWVIRFFDNSGRVTGAVGAFPTSGTSGSVSLSGVLAGGTTVSFDFDKTEAHAQLPDVTDIDDDISFDIDTPRAGEEWTLAVTNDYAGVFQTKLLHVRRISFPTSGAGTLVTDSLATSVAVT